MREQHNNIELIDISTVRVNSRLPKWERIAEYVCQIKNPKHYMCLGWEVTEGHPDDGPSIEDCLQSIAGVSVS